MTGKKNSSSQAADGKRTREGSEAVAEAQEKRQKTEVSEEYESEDDSETGGQVLQKEGEQQAGDEKQDAQDDQKVQNKAPLDGGKKAEPSNSSEVKPTAAKPVDHLANKPLSQITREQFLSRLNNPATLRSWARNSNVRLPGFDEDQTKGALQAPWVVPRLNSRFDNNMRSVMFHVLAHMREEDFELPQPEEIPVPSGEGRSRNALKPVIKPLRELGENVKRKALPGLHDSPPAWSANAKEIEAVDPKSSGGPGLNSNERVRLALIFSHHQNAEIRDHYYHGMNKDSLSDPAYPSRREMFDKLRAQFNDESFDVLADAPEIEVDLTRSNLDPNKNINFNRSQNMIQTGLRKLKNRFRHAEKPRSGINDGDVASRVEAQLDPADFACWWIIARGEPLASSDIDWKENCKKNGLQSFVPRVPQDEFDVSQIDGHNRGTSSSTSSSSISSSSISSSSTSCSLEVDSNGNNWTPLPKARLPSNDSPPLTNYAKKGSGKSAGSSSKASAPVIDLTYQQAYYDALGEKTRLEAHDEHESKKLNLEKQRAEAKRVKIQEKKDDIKSLEELAKQAEQEGDSKFANEIRKGIKKKRKDLARELMGSAYIKKVGDDEEEDDDDDEEEED